MTPRAPSPFTDEDLKRLKDYIANNIELLVESEIEEVLVMQAPLVARLEAAEEAVKDLKLSCPLCGETLIAQPPK